MKRNLTILLAVLIVAAAALVAWRKKAQNKSERRNAFSKVTVIEGPIEKSVEATGDVVPLNRVEIKPPIAGRIEKLMADEGDRVKAGSVLAWMSSSDRAAILDAARAQGEDEVKHWEDSYKPTPILAPLSGSVILRNVVVGQTVDASTILFAMSDRLIVVAQVDESDIGRVRQDMKTRITLDAYPDTSIGGHVFQILQEGKNVSNVITYGVKIAPENAPAFFRSQMTANVHFILDHVDKALLLPANAVQDGPSGKQVMIPDPEGRPTPQPIEIGIESSDKVEIKSGLQAGDTVFVMRSRYVPQKGPQSSPFTMGGRPASTNQNRRRQQ